MQNTQQLTLCLIETFKDATPTKEEPDYHVFLAVVKNAAEKSWQIIKEIHFTTDTPLHLKNEAHKLTFYTKEKARANLEKRNIQGIVSGNETQIEKLWNEVIIAIAEEIKHLNLTFSLSAKEGNFNCGSAARTILEEAGLSYITPHPTKGMDKKTQSKIAEQLPERTPYFSELGLE